MICGDFNEILEGEEHSTFPNSQSSQLGMREFQDITRYCSVQDLGYQGPLFTWCNKREEGVICKKLDRVLINEKLMERFPQAYSVFEASGCSDHLRGRVTFEWKESNVRKPFKFSNVLTSVPSFLANVEGCWKVTEPLFLSTSSLHKLSKKLKSLKPVLRGMGKEHLNDLSKRTREAYELLCVKQKTNLTAPTPQTMEEENAAFMKWQHLADLEEGYLKQKSKLHWLNVGDRNNAYFHKSIQTRKMQNAIREIKKLRESFLQIKKTLKQRLRGSSGIF